MPHSIATAILYHSSSPSANLCAKTTFFSIYTDEFKNWSFWSPSRALLTTSPAFPDVPLPPVPRILHPPCRRRRQGKGGCVTRLRAPGGKRWCRPTCGLMPHTNPEAHLLAARCFGTRWRRDREGSLRGPGPERLAGWGGEARGSGRSGLVSVWKASWKGA